MQITDISDDAREWLAAHLTLADRAGVNGSLEQLSEAFDDTVRTYLDGSGEEREKARAASAMFAVALGERLREELGMRWVILADDYGTDLAIHRRTDDGEDVYCCPVEVVDKRFEGEHQSGRLLSFHRQFLAKARLRLP